jgi:hypothetical protein
VTAKVLWRDAQGIEGSIELGTQEIRVGRSMDCAIRTDDAMVSRHHARIVWAGAGYMVEDLGSANKVYYQEQVVQQHMLRHGDAVRCGSLWLRFVDTAQLGQPAPAPVAPPAPAPMPMPAPMPAPMPIPPTAAQVPMPAPAPMAPPPTPMAPAPMAPGPAAGGGAGDDEEIRRLRRRIEQLQAELRAYRGGKVGQGGFFEKTLPPAFAGAPLP